LLTKRIRIVPRAKFVGEGWEAAEADVQHDTQRPHVNRLRVSAVFGMFQNLWSDVGWSAAECGSERLLADNLRESKVCQLDVQILVEE
jgi:hypothetical protein